MNELNMNELMVVLDCNPIRWIYYKTEADNIDAAWMDFTTHCYCAGINIDNLGVSQLFLRDADGDDIDHYAIKE